MFVITEGDVLWSRSVIGFGAGFRLSRNNGRGAGMGPRIREDKRGGAVYVCHGRDGRGLSWLGMGPRIREDKRGSVCVCHGRDGRGLSWMGMGPRIREDKRGGAVYVCHGRDGRGLSWVGMGPRIREDKRGGAVCVCHGRDGRGLSWLGWVPAFARTRGEGNHKGLPLREDVWRTIFIVVGEGILGRFRPSCRF